MSEVQKKKTKTIIAMKGYPFTRKSDFARLIATDLGCPVLSLDDFLDVMTPNYFQFQTSPSSSSSSNSCTPQPQDLAFGIIVQIAKSNLLKDLVTNIVIDSPLSSQSHLDQLISLAESAPNSRLVIVECKTDNTYKWQTEFEDYIRDVDCPEPKWYKANHWEDIDKAIRQGFDERSHGYKVPKLVLDPLLDYMNYNECALKYMMANINGDGGNGGLDLVVYQRWIHGTYIPSCIIGDNEKENDFQSDNAELVMKQSGPCRGGSGHYITNYMEEGLEGDCGACENLIRMGEPAYSCQLCSFALHKECAELVEDPSTSTSRVHPSEEDLYQLSWKGYPELKFRCGSCSGEEHHSESCGDCLFATHLRSQLLPTVIRHDCHHQHFLGVVFSILNPNEKYSLCKGCGYSFTYLWYSCKICAVAYHYECLTQMPVRLRHQHGGHRHHMVLQYSAKVAEDYICDVCFENEAADDRRDPSLWFYACEECPYVAHQLCGLLGMTEPYVKANT